MFIEVKEKRSKVKLNKIIVSFYCVIWLTLSCKAQHFLVEHPHGFIKVYLLNDLNIKKDSVVVREVMQNTNNVQYTFKDSTEIIILYEADGTNRNTGGTTINLIRFIIKNNKLTFQSDFKISKHLNGLEKYRFYLTSGKLLVYSEQGLIKDYLLSEHTDLKLLAEDLLKK